MKKILIVLISAWLMIMSSCGGKSSAKNQFCNPILAGFYPDPSICRVDSDYFLVNSTFAYYPGIPIFHSRDLVSWKLIGHVLDRPEQLNLDNLGVSRGIFAPAIRYYRGIFYVTCTLVDAGGNFVVTANSAAGPWSDPMWIPQINGIDPSMFFDDDDRAYIVYNSDAPDNKPLYDGHRTIRLYEFDTDSLKVTGPERTLLKIAAQENVYSFLYTSDLQNWQVLKDKVDATFLSTRAAGGFVGCLYALYATSSGKSSKNTAYYDWFEYQGDDEIYR